MAERQPTPSLLGLGLPWTRVGYCILLICAAAFVLWNVLHPVLPYAKGGAIPSGYRLVANKDGGLLLLASPLGALSVFLMIFSALTAFVWTFVDVIDRQKRFVWLLPMFVCPLVMGLHVLPFALYLFSGRETPVADPGVK
jgi:hypothetical protein